jgi:hypothetical protein
MYTKVKLKIKMEKAVMGEKEEEIEKDMPVPQVKIGPDGSIILNEERYKKKAKSDLEPF